MNHEKTFAAIAKLKEVELELHRLKNALEMMNRASEAKTKKKWKGLTRKERSDMWWATDMSGMPEHDYGKAVEEALRRKNADQ